MSIESQVNQALKKIQYESWNIWNRIEYLLETV